MTPEDTKIHLRIGVTLGVDESERDISSDVVNVSSTIEPIAGGRGLYLTRQVYDRADLDEGPTMPPTVPLDQP